MTNRRRMCGVSGSGMINQMLFERHGMNDEPN